jgi:hypothetical protein
MTAMTRKPDFLIIGAQKAGTTWLWKMLDRHPETRLPAEKEIHFFGSSELYNQGTDAYFAHFDGIDTGLVTGEASTTYLSDRPAFFYNSDNRLEYDTSLPLLPELVRTTLPDVKIIVCLRDPVRRAMSAYFHWMRKGELPVLDGLKKTAANHPRLRLIEMGDYQRHLGAWMDAFPRDRILVLAFEDDVIRNPANGLEKLYRFIGVDAGFVPDDREAKAHRSWNWTRIVANYYAGPMRSVINREPIAGLLERNDWLKKRAISAGDLDFLREAYLPQKEPLRAMVGDMVDLWSYGEDLGR